MKVYVDEFHKTVHFAGSYYNRSLLSDRDQVEKQIQQDFIDAGFPLQQSGSYKLLVDFGGEGHCDLISSNLIDCLCSLEWRDLLVLFKTKVDIQKLSYPAVSLIENMANHGGWFDLIDQVEYNDHVDTKFLCLIRRPSPSRAKIAAALDSIDSVRLSFGSNRTPEQMIEYQEYFPGTPLPILIDGYTMRGTDLPEHDQRNPIFHSSLFNLIVESSSQTDPDVWSSIFVTEKTYKSFGLRQIPIWFAVPGLVSTVKSMGFDVFDDIIDHTYDDITDEYQRHAFVIDMIKSLDNRYSVTQCQDLRRSISDRLSYNYMLLRKLTASSTEKYQQALERLHGS